MMKRVSTLLLLVASVASITVRAEVGYQIMMLDTTSDTKQLKKVFPEAEIHNLSESEKLLRAETLTLHDQAIFFEKSGLASYVKPLDQLDRDLLVRWMRHYDAAKVHLRYKNIPKETCAKAIKILHTY